MTLFFGKTAATPRPSDFKVSTYLDTTLLPKPPGHFGHDDRMPLPRLMLGNGPDDSVSPGFQGAGDCFWAMCCNAIRLATSLAGYPAPFTGKQAIAAYSEATGYDLDATEADGSNPTDQGTNMHDGLDFWRKKGIADATGHRHKLGAYLALDLDNLENELEALYLLDVGLALGIVVPPTAMQEFLDGKPWTGTGHSDEGHAILWDAHRNYETVETWARAQPASHTFVKKQADEVFALILPEMLNGGLSVEGFNLKQLQADVAAL